MKKSILEFLRRGAIACGAGPIVLAIVYMVLYHRASVNTLTVEQVCMGIFSLTALAFIAGGMNSIYQIERIPLMPAILIHGGVLYIGYLVVYLLNGWIEWGTAPILVFSGIFIVGFFAIWAIIYLVIRKNTKMLNEKLKEKQSTADTEM